jgi:hypothetical protein
MTLLTIPGIENGHNCSVAANGPALAFPEHTFGPAAGCQKTSFAIWNKTNNIALPDQIHNRPGLTSYGISKSKHYRL